MDRLYRSVSFAKEPYKRDYILQKDTYDFKEPTHRSHPMSKEPYKRYYILYSNTRHQ